MKRISKILYRRKPEESKVIKLIVFIFVMFITSLIVPTITKAGSIHHVSGRLADASFFSLDPPGCNAVCPSPTSCIETDVFLSISDQKVQTPPGSAGKSVPQVNFFSIFQFDACTGETLFDTNQCSPPTAINLQIAKKLDSATLNMALECFEFVSSSNVDVTANLTWIATGAPPTTERSSSHLFFPGCKINARFDGIFTPAQASGTVSVGTTNFTPNPTGSAEIVSVKSGEVDIGCPIPTPPPTPTP